jgi:hypothetical protein
MAMAPGSRWPDHSDPDRSSSWATCSSSSTGAKIVPSKDDKQVGSKLVVVEPDPRRRGARAGRRVPLAQVHPRRVQGWRRGRSRRARPAAVRRRHRGGLRARRPAAHQQRHAAAGRALRDGRPRVRRGPGAIGAFYMLVGRAPRLQKWTRSRPSLAAIVVSGGAAGFALMRHGQLSGWTAPPAPRCADGVSAAGWRLPAPGGYPQQGGGYPPQGGGYPPQGGGYPPQAAVAILPRAAVAILRRAAVAILPRAATAAELGRGRVEARCGAPRAFSGSGSETESRTAPSRRSRRRPRPRRGSPTASSDRRRRARRGSTSRTDRDRRRRPDPPRRRRRDRSTRARCRCACRRCTGRRRSARR